MIYDELAATIDALVVRGKGLLAADESTKTIGKRFDAINVENTEEHRRQYRSLLASTVGLEDYVSGVILFEETLGQKTDQGVLIPEALQEKGIVSGIKVDKGLTPLTAQTDETITQGLDGLTDRLLEYKKQGARFAKWRSVFSITDLTPSGAGVHANAEVLARYAAICQGVGIVPIVEPELLMDGDHTLDDCAEVTEEILMEVFTALNVHGVALEQMILKPNMVIPGQDCPDQSSPEEIGDATITIFRRTVPAAVPAIMFLSGGQSPERATENLEAINSFGPQPWLLSFSYGRALQEPVIKAWKGEKSGVPAAQEALITRSKANSEAMNND